MSFREREALRRAIEATRRLQDRQPPPREVADDTTEEATEEAARQFEREQRARGEGKTP